jgi:phosphoribosylanthranilate isomerase
MHIKICGVTTPEDAELAARLGATAIGLNFYEESPRRVSWDVAKQILGILPPLVDPVLVLVNPDLRDTSVRMLMNRMRTIQLHAFSEDRWPELLKYVPGGAVILGHGVATPDDRLRFEAQLEHWRRKLPLMLNLRATSVRLLPKSVRRQLHPELRAEFQPAVPSISVLFDAKVPGQHGGTGQQAPWHLLADWQMPFPLILAGGLTPENVAEAIRIVRPYGVDVASGVESVPGVKEAEKMRRFIGNALEAAAKYMTGK